MTKVGQVHVGRSRICSSKMKHVIPIPFEITIVEDEAENEELARRWEGILRVVLDAIPRVEEERRRQDPPPPRPVVRQRIRMTQETRAGIGLFLQVLTDIVVIVLLVSGLGDILIDDILVDRLPSLVLISIPVGLPAFFIGVFQVIFRKRGYENIVGYRLIFILLIVLSLYYGKQEADWFLAIIFNSIFPLIILGITAIPGFLLLGRYDN